MLKSSGYPGTIAIIISPDWGIKSKLAFIVTAHVRIKSRWQINLNFFASKNHY